MAVRAWSGRTTPGRLRRVGAVLVLGCVAAAAVSATTAAARVDAVGDGGRLAALTADAAAIHQSLADADATATGGFVAGGREMPEVRARYEADVDRAARGLVAAAGRLPDGDPALAAVSGATERLADYTALIEQARGLDRLGLPLGQAALSAGSELMREEILPAVTRLQAAESAALGDALRRGAAVPVAVLLLGPALLVALVDVGLGERRRTRRDLEPGLLVAAAAATLALLGWAGSGLGAGAALEAAGRHATAAGALDGARIAAAQARSNESLVLVARSGGSADSGFRAELGRVLDAGGALDVAAAAGADVGPLRDAALVWEAAHREVRALDDGGRYRDAVAAAVGPDPAGSGATFTGFDDALAAAVAAERAGFAEDMERAAAHGTLLVAVPAPLLLLAGAAVAAGIGRRVGEYR